MHGLARARLSHSSSINENSAPGMADNGVPFMRPQQAFNRSRRMAGRAVLRLFDFQRQTSSLSSCFRFKAPLRNNYVSIPDDSFWYGLNSLAVPQCACLPSTSCVSAATYTRPTNPWRTPSLSAKSIFGLLPGATDSCLECCKRACFFCLMTIQELCLLDNVGC